MPRPLIAVAAVVAVLSVSAFALLSREEPRAEAVGPSAPNQMAVDADPGTPGVQSTRTIVGPGNFTIGIDITQIGEPYALYQWELGFGTAGMNFTGDFFYHNEVTGFAHCGSPFFSTGGPGETLLTDGYCGGTLLSDTSTFVGEVVTVTMRCLADGTYVLRLPDRQADSSFGNVLSRTNGVTLDTGTTGASVTCNSVGVVPTSTSTPVVPSPTPRPAGPNVMSLDAMIGLAGVQTSRDAFGSAQFSIGIVVSSLGSENYAGYQWLVEFSPLGVAFDNATEHSTASGMGFCATPGNIISLVPRRLYGGCGANTNQTSAFVGQLTTLRFHCLSEGSFPINLATVADDAGFGSGFIRDGSFTLMDTATTGITIDCQAEPAPTNTATATSTATATYTATATATPPLPAFDGVAKDTGVRPQDPLFAFTIGNIFLCKPIGSANANLPAAGAFSGAGESACGVFKIAEVGQAPTGTDTCNDDDDGDGKPCAGLSTSPRDPYQAATDTCLNVATDYMPGQTAVDCDSNVPGTINGSGEGAEGLGAFEFQVKFDDKLFTSPTFSCTVAPDGSPAVLGSTGRYVAAQVSIITENWVQFGCISKNHAPGQPGLPVVPGADITNASVLGTLTLTAQGDLFSRMRPAKDNGVSTNLLDENCEFADILGQPYNLGLGFYGNNQAPSGGLTRECKDAALTIRMLEGDIDLNCAVDINDDQGIAFRYGQFFGQLNYNRFFDIEPGISPDFDIDIKDVQTVFGRNGSTCANPLPPQPPLTTIPDP